MRLLLQQSLLFVVAVIATTTFALMRTVKPDAHSPDILLDSKPAPALANLDVCTKEYLTAVSQLAASVYADTLRSSSVAGSAAMEDIHYDHDRTTIRIGDDKYRGDAFDESVRSELLRVAALQRTACGAVRSDRTSLSDLLVKEMATVASAASAAADRDRKAIVKAKQKKAPRATAPPRR
jgi:hypothetical protein